MKKFFSHKILWTVLTAVMAVLFAVFLVAYFVTMQFSAAINMALGTSNHKRIDDPDAKEKVEFKTDYEAWNGETILKHDKEIIKEAVGEGVTMLWNQNSALPLDKGKNVSLLGNASANLIESGSGSGYVATKKPGNGNPSLATDLKTALTNVNLNVNDTLWNFYKSGAASSYKKSDPGTGCIEWYEWKNNEAPWSVYNSSVTDSFASYGDAAIIVLSRMGGEYTDLHYSYSSHTDFTGRNDQNNGENTSANGGYLGLTNEEDELIQHVLQYKNQGTFKKVVLLLNTANPLQMQDFDNYINDIDACLWIGQVGSTGAEAVAEILVGDINPSGHLTDTYAYDLNSAPSTVNDGNYAYDNYSTMLTGRNTENLEYDMTYMVYQEGIYVGYKYYETRYADLVLNQGSADSAKGAKHSSSGWDYEQEVAFPFGYGLSYTTFEYSGFGAKKSGNNYEVTVTVKNTGSRAGKEAVQVYLQKPYTSNDKTNGIEKSAIELAGIAKTRLLEPNDSQKVTVTVPAEYFKTYDANNKETYIIEAGDYYLTVGTDAHVALNNVLALSNSNAQTSQSVMGGNVKPAVMGKDFAEKFTLKDDFETYSSSTQTGEEIKNQFDSGDINKYENKGTNSVTYLSRSDWDATYPSKVNMTLNTAMAADLGNSFTPDDTGYTMPTYNKLLSGGTEADIQAGDKVAFQFINIPLNKYNEVWEESYENDWEQLLDQMSFEEQAFLCANAYHQLNGAASINLLASKQENGPVGITERTESNFAIPSTEHAKDWTFVAYPCAPLLGATFNIELTEEVGKHMSEDMFYLGYNGIYGPGANMHRTPFGGRAFEYASEDSFLTGIIAAYQSKGIESKGCLAYVKHYALNDTETNRRHVAIWANEQTIREIYLRPFEIAFTDGKASATMNSFTRVGTRWTGASKEMMTNVLRTEWGWDGINITDWRRDQDNVMSYVDAILAGTNSFDGNGTADMFKPYKDSPAVCQALRESAKIIIYNVVRTNAYNGASITTRSIKVTPWWQQALIAGSAVFGSLFAISGGLCAACWVLNVRNKSDNSESAQTNEQV